MKRDGEGNGLNIEGEQRVSILSPQQSREKIKSFQPSSKTDFGEG